MGLKTVTVEVPEVSSLLLDTAVEIARDVRDKKWGEIAEDLFKVVRQYESLSEVKEELKTPEIAVAIGLAIGQAVASFLPKKVAAAATAALVEDVAVNALDSNALPG